jgi:hypothetical protein
MPAVTYSGPLSAVTVDRAGALPEGSAAGWLRSRVQVGGGGQVATQAAQAILPQFARSPRRYALVGGAGGLAMIGVGITVAFTGRSR